MTKITKNKLVEFETTHLTMHNLNLCTCGGPYSNFQSVIRQIHIILVYVYMCPLLCFCDWGAGGPHKIY